MGEPLRAKEPAAFDRQLCWVRRRLRGSDGSDPPGGKQGNVSSIAH